MNSSPPLEATDSSDMITIIQTFRRINRGKQTIGFNVLLEAWTIWNKTKNQEWKTKLSKQAIASGDQWGWRKIDCKKMPTVVRFWARKISQPKQTIWNISRPCRKEAHHLDRTSSEFWPKARYRIKMTPWNPPQRTKVHAAPCHRPPRTMVIIRFL